MSGGRLNIPAPGPGALEFMSPSTQFRGAQGVVFVEDASVANPGSTNPSDITENGLVIKNGIYTITGSSTPASRYSLKVGVTRGSTARSGGVSRIYAGTIDNIWHNNDIPEHHRTTFAHNSVVVSSGPAPWTAEYNNSDLNGDGDVSDPINPFELLSPSSTNDPPMDGVVATLTEQQYLERVTLHEVGHALGMSLGNRHPTSGLSVMRSGPGPARVSTFSAADIAQVKLK